jgi:hypothetical protein
MTMKRVWIAGLLAAAVIVPAARTADEENPAKEALQALNEFIGSWKGAGGNLSKSENWKENFSWTWKFKGGEPSMLVAFKGSKNFDKGVLRYLPEKKKYELTVTDKDGAEQVFVGELKKKFLTLDRADAKSGETYRLSINTAAEGLRFIYTYSRKAKGSTIFTKLYEVASNKEGESLAGGVKEKECVITGGLGTIAVSYNGKTYYVCCTGCRDEFNQNPAKAVKEYEERKKKGN